MSSAHIAVVTGMFLTIGDGTALGITAQKSTGLSKLPWSETILSGLVSLRVAPSQAEEVRPSR